MSDQSPSPDWRNPWQQQLSVRRDIERIRNNAGLSTDQSGVTEAQKRRFQLIETFKMFAVVLGVIAALALIGLFFTFVVPLK